MLARLWWKEYRTFAPAWLVLVLAAGLLQWFLVAVDGVDRKGSGLTVLALLWALLYAFAAGAAAFAGERESNTLPFLDALPVGRWTLWLGKASFAAASTFGLAVALAAIAELGRTPWEPGRPFVADAPARAFGILLFEAVAWSLLWSSLSRNPLLAGVLGVLSLYASAIAVDVTMSPQYRAADDYALTSAEAVPGRLALASAALAVSGLVMAWRPAAWRRRRKPRAVPAPRPIPIRRSSTGRSLAWQAGREGWTTWVLVAAVGLGVPVVAGSGPAPGDALVAMLFGAVASLVAGVSVFGTETASGSRRFLVHHGVRPGAAWGWKLLAWGLVTGAIFGGPALLSAAGFSAATLGPGGNAWAPGTAPIFGLTMLNGFAVGLLCGMAIPRRITAALASVIVLVAILPIQVAAADNRMVPAWSVFLVPLALLTASRAWAADWLFDREGARPWLRLAAWTVVPCSLLGASFIAYRAYSIEDVGPQYVAANLQVPAIPPDRDAAEAYRRAAALVSPDPDLRFTSDGGTNPAVEEVIEMGWPRPAVGPTTEGQPRPAGEVMARPYVGHVAAYWEKNRPAIEAARQATTLPSGRFGDLGAIGLTSGEDGTLKGVQTLAALLALDTRERLARGDLPGTWDDVLAQFRMAGQLGEGLPNLSRAMLAADIHRRAVGLAFEWLAAPGLASEAVLRALADVKALPPPPGLAATIQVESAILERALDLPGDELASLYLRDRYRRTPTMMEHLWFATMVAPPWERQRARRACRLLTARELREATLEPSRRGAGPDPLFDPGSEYKVGPSLTRLLLPYYRAGIDRLDREVVARRALEQAVAIEAWKLGHAGEYPPKLDDLVPTFLARLPLDPYSGRPFGYVRSEGQLARPPILPDSGPGHRAIATRPGQPLLYSVGPDRSDDRAVSVLPGQRAAADLVYPIP